MCLKCFIYVFPHFFLISRRWLMPMIVPTTARVVPFEKDVVFKLYSQMAKG